MEEVEEDQFEVVDIRVFHQREDELSESKLKSYKKFLVDSFEETPYLKQWKNLVI